MGSKGRQPITVLGGGPAGLAAGYYARKRKLDVHIYEAGSEVGGNARTLRLGDFRFDAGAHRFHDRDPEVTAEVKNLLGSDLLRVHAPSQIYWKGRFIDFPLSPYDLSTKLEARTLLRITRENIARLFGQKQGASDFGTMAREAYGDTLAEMFLLNYSEKLWGAPCDQLSTNVAGSRLKGLDLKTFLIEALLGKRRKTTHLDGSFYYPRYGFGTIFEALARDIGAQHIHCDARITGLEHEGGRIQRVVVNGDTSLDVDTVISTLPLTLMMRLLQPAPPADLLALINTIRFRHLQLCVVLLDRPHVTPNASVYFPDRAQPYTRLYEPKNRSPYMAPSHQTAAVLEIPCADGDSYWEMSEEELEREIRGSLKDMGLFEEREVLGFKSYRLPYAYPVLEVGYEEKARRLLSYLQSFDNLHLLGRSARFEYTHIHNLFADARSMIEAYSAAAPQEA